MGLHRHWCWVTTGVCDRGYWIPANTGVCGHNGSAHITPRNSVSAPGKTYFWVSMEQLPADARAAPSASEPNDTVMDIHASPKRQRESSQGNMVSQRTTSSASVSIAYCLRASL
eukprot:scaffold8596_cov128-Isochrysis_galbana.AAC.1